MSSNQNNESNSPTAAPAEPSSEEIIRQLRQLPVEVLQDALRVLQMRQARPKA
jgi:hypothetical protein